MTQYDVATSTQQATDLASNMIMVNVKGIEPAIAVVAAPTCGAHAVLLGEHGVILCDGDPKFPLQVAAPMDS
jgi:hypothetical protein